MLEQVGIVLKPVGVVRSPQKLPDDVPLPGQPAVVEIFPQYQAALHRVEENSHLWMLLWFHQADRTVLRTAPRRINPDLPDFGVFGLRSPNRPNPIALSLVRLEGVSGNNLLVQGLDAIDGTPVLDIKSYYEQDIIFSPRTPYIRAVDPVIRREIMLKHAFNHHQERCPDMLMAVRMALVADEYMGHLNRPDLQVMVRGPACLADTIQGITQARLANPLRFAYLGESEMSYTTWKSADHTLELTGLIRLDEDTFTSIPDETLFNINFM